MPRTPELALANSMAAERRQVHFIDNLNYLLGWPGSADDIAQHLGVVDAAVIERRFARMGITETVIAEAFRQRKPDYCSECRLIHGQHRSTCTSFVQFGTPPPSVVGKRRAKRRVAA